jgi:hypothetical protein
VELTEMRAEHTLVPEGWTNTSRIPATSFRWITESVGVGIFLERDGFRIPPRGDEPEEGSGLEHADDGEQDNEDNQADYEEPDDFDPPPSQMPISGAHRDVIPPRPRRVKSALELIDTPTESIVASELVQVDLQRSDAGFRVQREFGIVEDSFPLPDEGVVIRSGRIALAHWRWDPQAG